MNLAQRGNHSTRLVRIAIVVLLVFTLALTYFLCHFTYIIPEETEKRFFTIVMTVTYANKNNEAKRWNFTDDDRAVGLFMNNTWQTVYLTKASYPIDRIEEDGDGNPVAFLSFSKSGVSFGENLTYEVKYRVVLKPRSLPSISESDSKTLDDIRKDLKDLYCGAKGPWQVNDSRLIELAYNIVGNEKNVLTIVKKFIEWIRHHISYRTSEVPRYPNETFIEKAGDCDDQANLLITLCRIVGIPSYLQIGCIYMPQKYELNAYWNHHLISNLTRIGWHGWAMVYVPLWGWLPVDLTFASLGADPLNAIKTSAIIMHPTVQYLNITRTDYAANSRDFRDFLITHDFYVYEQDAMSEEVIEETIEEIIPYLKPQLSDSIPFFSLTFTSRPGIRIVNYVRTLCCS